MAWAISEHDLEDLYTGGAGHTFTIVEPDGRSFPAKVQHVTKHEAIGEWHNDSGDRPLLTASGWLKPDFTQSFYVSVWRLGSEITTLVTTVRPGETTYAYSARLGDPVKYRSEFPSVLETDCAIGPVEAMKDDDPLPPCDFASSDWPYGEPVYIDVLVYYMGERPGHPNFVMTAIEQANMIMVESRVNVVFNLSRLIRLDSRGYRVKYAMFRLKNRMEPFVNLNEQRANADADLVSVILEFPEYRPSHGAGGFAMIPQPDEAGSIAHFLPDALSVVHSERAVTTATFAHELCHNLGCGHQLGSRHGDAYCEGAAGYLFEHEGKGWATLMVSNVSDRYERLPILSSSALMWNGRPLGVDRDHENARVVRMSARQIAAFYP